MALGVFRGVFVLETDRGHYERKGVVVIDMTATLIALALCLTALRQLLKT